MEVVTPKFCDDIRDRFDIEVRPDYSGRFMWGRQCFAIVGGADALFKFGMKLPELLRDMQREGEDQDEDLMPLLEDIEISEEWFDMRWDNMARDLVFYWPNVLVSQASIEADESAEMVITPNTPPDFSEGA